MTVLFTVLLIIILVWCSDVTWMLGQAGKEAIVLGRCGTIKVLSCTAPCDLRWGISLRSCSHGQIEIEKIKEDK